jgi:ABC-type dipeptide/oligopeptide/nickel transport system ATPase component
MPPLLAVDNLAVVFDGVRSGPVQAVRGLSFTVSPGEVVAIVGESGSGKSVTALSLMRLIEREGGRITSGSIRYRDKSGLDQDLRLLMSIRCARCGAVPSP